MKKLNILIIGAGGREHALAWKITQSKRLKKLFVAPGNAGTSKIATNLELDISNHQSVIAACRSNHIDMVLIGPDDALAAGLADDLQTRNIAVFGPSKAAALIEASKSFAKEIMRSAGVHTASYQEFTDFDKAVEYIKKITPPIVIKADGLALGKGVIIAQDHNQAQTALATMIQDNTFGDSGHKVVIEEFLEGVEISTHAFCDGKNYSMFPSAQDYKPIGEGDKGPNTGGMGTIAPVPWMSKADVTKLGQKLVAPILKELNNLNSSFCGCLYPGLMMSAGNYHVVEYNARFGDPETQSYMRLLKTDLVDIIEACIKGQLQNLKIEWNPGYACCIVLASAGYPANYTKGEIINGVDKAESMEDIVVFHAGTKQESGNLITNGGRVLGVTATSQSLDEALNKAYKAVKKISFTGMQYRKDIGKRPLPDWK